MTPKAEAAQAALKMWNILKSAARKASPQSTEEEIFQLTSEWMNKVIKKTK